jgi:hypothetical protein
MASILFYLLTFQKNVSSPGACIRVKKTSLKLSANGIKWSTFSANFRKVHNSHKSWKNFFEIVNKWHQIKRNFR